MSVARVPGRDGFEVETAKNAEVGLAMLEKYHFDVLISDVIMPEIDGVQAITTAAYLQAAAEAGADWVLTKPFERAELIDCVRCLLDKD